MVSFQIGAILVLIIAGLSLNVSYLRITRRVSLGDGGDKSLRNGIRAHGNAIECFLPFMIILYFYERQGADAALIWSWGLLFLGSRLLHIVGMLAYKIPFRHRMRQVGAFFTLVCLVAIPVLILVD